jgi:hypothetical protein
MQKQALCQSMVMPVGMIGEAPPPEIEALMQEFILGQKKKLPKLVKPKLRACGTDGWLATVNFSYH